MKKTATTLPLFLPPQLHARDLQLQFLPLDKQLPESNARAIEASENEGAFPDAAFEKFFQAWLAFIHSLSGLVQTACRWQAHHKMRKPASPERFRLDKYQITM